VIKSSSAVPASERRIALVIGNGGYSTLPKIPNAPNDANLAAKTLRDVGFEVEIIVDASRDRLKEALQSFAGKAKDADWALFYYAGAGVSFEGKEYLVPVDTEFSTAAALRDRAIALDDVLSAIEGAKAFSLVVFDAGREPIVADGQVLTGRSAITVPVSRPVRPLIFYSSQQGKIVMDGDGRNSPFAIAFSTHLPTPGLELNAFFRRVREDVVAATGHQQEPTVYGLLPGRRDFYFVSK
jgi:uncharacterized caspase-like protein